MPAQWLIPWRTRGISGCIRDNLLWQDGCLYVMDNHRLAQWCWWQHLDGTRKWGFFHMDRHYDAIWEKAGFWKKHHKLEHRSALAAYQTATFRDGSDSAAMILYRWDSITGSLWALNKAELKAVRFATAQENKAPRIRGALHSLPWEVIGELEWLAETDEHEQGPWIIDIDIDYFTRKDKGTGTVQPVIADSYVRQLGQYLVEGMANGNFGVVTVALSPETTGSWQLAEHYLGLLLEGVPSYRGHFLQGAPQPNSS